MRFPYHGISRHVKWDGLTALLVVTGYVAHVCGYTIFNMCISKAMEDAVP